MTDQPRTIAQNPQELVVFVASPSDVPAERELVRSVAERVEQACLSLGVRIRVTGWEQLAPGYGRPQDLINPLVDECDIFVALLYRRWGTEAGGGQTGFEEEFNRAIARRQAGTDRPAIALFFKRVEPEQEDDPGNQLLRVIEFRNRVRDERQILYKDFDAPEELQAELYHLLVSLAVATIGGSRVQPDSTPGPEHGGSRDVSDGTSGTEEPTGAHAQLASMLDRFLQPLRGEEFPDDANPDRLVLFASAFRTEAQLPTHVAHRLYRHREEIKLIAGEARSWLRALLMDLSADDEANMVLPGWFFVGESDLTTLTDLLADDDAALSQGALAVMRRLATKPESLWPSAGASMEARRTSATSWWTLINGNPGAKATLDYMSATAVTQDAAFIHEIAVQEPGGLWVSEIQAIAAALENDIEPMVELVGKASYSVPSWVSRTLKTHIEQLNLQQAARIINSKASGDLKRAVAEAVSVLSLRDADLATFGKALESDEFDNEAIFEGIAHSEDPSATASVVRESLGDKGDWQVRARLMSIAEPADRLRPKAKELLGGGAWEALAWRQDPDTLAEGREMLREGPEAWEDRYRGDPLFRDHLDVVRFIYDQRAQAILEALSRLPVQARETADHDLALAEARRVPTWRAFATALRLARYGVTTDARLLLEIAEKTYGDRREELIRAALELGGIPIAREAADAAATETGLAGVRFLADSADVDAKELEAYLPHADSRIRLQALSGICRRSTSAQLLELLNRYTERTYYYNVVAALDRVLFGPSGITGLPRPAS